MKKKKSKLYLLGVAIFLFITWVVCEYVAEGVEVENQFLLGFILFFISFIALTIVPFCLRIYCGKRLEYTFGKKVCTYNSIFINIIFMIFFVLFGFGFIIGWLNAYLYYLVNMALFVESKDESNEVLIGDNFFKCDQCGALVSDDDTKCPKCGALFIDDELIDSRNKNDHKKIDDTEEFECSYCGASIKGTESKCPKCGAIFVDDDYCEEEIPAVIDDYNHKFKCDNCGAVVPEDAIECPNCGEKFEENLPNPNDDLANIFNEAVNLTKSFNFDKAEETFKKYIKLTERLLKFDNYTCYTFNNCVEFTISVEKKLINNSAIDCNYETSNAYLYLGMICFDKHDYDSCIKYQNKSLKLNPCNISAMFEKAESYKAKGDIEKYYEENSKTFEFIYNITDLARYYRNLGYYYIEKEDWLLANTVYLYSLKYDFNETALHEMTYIRQKSKTSDLPDKKYLTNILRENSIPTFISKNNLNIIKKLRQNLEDEGEMDSSIGNFIFELMKKNANSKE